VIVGIVPPLLRLSEFYGHRDGLQQFRTKSREGQGCVRSERKNRLAPNGALPHLAKSFFGSLHGQESADLRFDAGDLYSVLLSG
jgi:hypothetical protein